MKCIKDKER